MNSLFLRKLIPAGKAMINTCGVFHALFFSGWDNFLKNLYTS